MCVGYIYRSCVCVCVYVVCTCVRVCEYVLVQRLIGCQIKEIIKDFMFVCYYT